ncbi:MAG: hypothetical protein UHD09_02300 [Bifidobacterium sp.]|nr:hypothetical protein [Bifidobacterium sp.]
MNFDKRQIAIEHIRQISFPNRDPADMLVTSWLDGFDYALDLCMIVIDQLDPDDQLDTDPQFSGKNQ